MPIFAAWHLDNTAPKKRRNVGDTVPDLTYPGFETQTFRTNKNVLTTELTGRYIFHCKQEKFQLLVSCNPNLSTLDVTSCWSLNDECICLCAKSCSKLKTLNLTNIYAITDQSLSAVAASCPDLTTLAISGCWRITNDGIRLVCM